LDLEQQPTAQRAMSIGDLMSRSAQVYRFVYAAGLERTRAVPFAPKKSKYASLQVAEEMKT
jgi:hypothetical protein